MRTISVCKSIVVSLALGSASLAIAGETSLVGVGLLPGHDPDRDSFANAVSANGKVVCGRAFTGFFVYEPFYWTRRKGIRGPGIQGTDFHDVSGDGRIFTGTLYDGVAVRGYYWTRDGGMVWLPDLPGGDEYNGAGDTNWDGSVIVGVSMSDRSELLEAYRWTSNGGIEALGDLPGNQFYSKALGVSSDGSVVVGESHSECGDQAFRWTANSGMIGLGDLLGGRVPCFSEALGISADGLVIVGTSESADGLEAFRWTEETGMIGLGDIEGGHFESHALSASADGSVIVGYGTPDVNFNRDRAVVWESTRGMVLLRDRLHEFGVDTSDWRTFGDGDDVSWDGFTIVGTGSRFDGTVEGFVAHFPCLEFCDRCTTQERLKATCSADEQGQRAITAKLRRAKPGATVRFVLDYYQRTTEATIGPDGRATVTWTDIPPGLHHVGLRECDASADVECP